MMNSANLTSAFCDRQPRLFLAPATIYQRGLLTEEDKGLPLWDEGRQVGDLGQV